MKLGTQPAPEVQLHREVIQCTAPARVRVHFHLLAADEVGAAAAEVVEFPPQLKAAPHAHCLRHRRQLVVQQQLDVNEDDVRQLADLMRGEREACLCREGRLGLIVDGPFLALGEQEEVTDARVPAGDDREGSVTP